jgi:C-terminal processing protease CtpA/Prc
VGFGFSLGLEDNRLFVKYVYQDSPAYRAGLRRDTEILEINGLSIEKIEEEKRWETILGKVAVGSSSHFKISKENQESWVTLSMEKVTIDSLFYSHVMNVEGKKVGYFVLNSFIEPTKLALKRVFETFKEEGIEELIVDMRYNGGGRISVAKHLASLIVGDKGDEDLWSSLEYNDKHLSQNKSMFFIKKQNSLHLERVFVLSSTKTCSSSELIINGLNPYMEVILIGSTTCGKPVGMQGTTFCGKHLSPIEFKILNADGYGDYFSGITPLCQVEDDLTHALGDNKESILREALFVIEESHCSSKNKKEGLGHKRNIPQEHLLNIGISREVGIY